MKVLKTFFVFVAFIAAFTIAGCNKEEGGTNPTNNNNNNNQQNQNTPIPQDPAIQGATNVIVVVRTTITQAGFEISTGVGTANLNGQDKGDVTATVNGTAYTFAKTTSNGSTYYTFPNPNDPTNMMNLPSGAANVTFNVTNYALSQNVVNLPGAVTLSEPSAGSTVSRSSDLTVSWSENSPGENSAIFIVDSEGKTVFKQINGASTGTFTASELGSLSAGSTLVYAITYNYKLGNNDEAVIIGEAIALNQITLQ